MERLDGLLVEGSRRLAWVAVCGLLLISLVIMIDVLLRWLFSSPLHGLEDIVGLVTQVAVAACFPASFALGTHITVRFLGRALGLRATLVLDAFGQLAALCWIVLVAWQLWLYAGPIGNRTTFILQIEIQPLWYVAAAFMILAALVQFLVFLMHVVAAVTGHAAPQRAEHLF